jgi:hypothetical protein
MNNEENKPKETPPPPSSEEKPDPNIKPPAYEYITEGFDVDRLKKKPS